jgi:hypothetical protein
VIPVVSIVEGHGEVSALPVLLRRICAWQTPECNTVLLPPIRVQRDRFLNRDDEFCRVLTLAAAKSSNEGWILILLDADDDCPAVRGAAILQQARTKIPHRRISVVLANREYEAWFIASAPSLHGHRGFSFGADSVPQNAEGIRDAKGWVRARLASGTYGETTDQPSFSALMDLQQAFDRSRSFRKLCTEWQRTFGA